MCLYAHLIVCVCRRVAKESLRCSVRVFERLRVCTCRERVYVSGPFRACCNRVLVARCRVQVMLHICPCVCCSGVLLSRAHISLSLFFLPCTVYLAERAQLAGATGPAANAAQARLAAFQQRAALSAKADELRAKMATTQLSAFRTEAKQREAVLRRLGHLNEDGVVTLKGRAACEIDTADELLAAEMLLNGKCVCSNTICD